MICLDRERTFSNPKVAPGEAGGLHRLALRRTESTIGRYVVQIECMLVPSECTAHARVCVCRRSDGTRVKKWRGSLSANRV
ncbi:hypothetical protein AOLI_G00302310 [Acnodon oligacanthus]